jgi:hypothetical protein
LFVHVYCLIDDAIKAGVLSIPRRPGPAPACTDAELLTIALVRHLLGRRSESRFLAEIRRDWAHLFPHLPDQPEVNRRTRWLWGAFEQLRGAWAAAVPADPVQQVDTSALPVKRPSRVRGPDGWTGPGIGLAARFGPRRRPRRMVLRLLPGRENGPGQPDRPRLGHRARRCERARGRHRSARRRPAPHDLLAGKGFSGRAFAASQTARVTAVLVPATADTPERKQHRPSSNLRCRFRSGGRSNRCLGHQAGNLRGQLRRCRRPE